MHKIIVNYIAVAIKQLLGSLAQVVEHLTFNQVVRGSNPRWLTKWDLISN